MLEPKDSKHSISDIPFIVTKQVKETAGVCHALIETKDMGVVYGNPGVGKTITAEHIIEKWKTPQKPKAVYIEADVCSTPAGIANKILRRISNLRPANAADAARIIENLSQEQNLDLMIIDEAERLNRKCVEMVRSIYDRTNIPILLIGMVDILRQHILFYLYLFLKQRQSYC